MLQYHQATYPAGILCLSQEELSTPLSPKEDQYTDIIFKLHLVLSASPCLKLCGDPEVTGDVRSPYLSKAGKEKWHRRRTLGRTNYSPFLCKDGTSSPSLFLGAMSKHLALFPYQAQPKKGKQTLRSLQPRTAEKVLAFPLQPRHRLQKSSSFLRGTGAPRFPPSLLCLPPISSSSTRGGCCFSPPPHPLPRLPPGATGEGRTHPHTNPPALTSREGGCSHSHGRHPLTPPTHTGGRSAPTPHVSPSLQAPPPPAAAAATHRRFAGRCPRRPRGGPLPAGRPAALQLPLAVEGPEPHVGQEDEGGQRQPHRLQQPLLLPPHRSRRRGGGDGGGRGGTEGAERGPTRPGPAAPAAALREPNFPPRARRRQRRAATPALPLRSARAGGVGVASEAPPTAAGGRPRPAEPAPPPPLPSPPPPPSALPANDSPPLMTL